MSQVSIEGVRKSYGSQAVIHGVDLEISAGEFVVIVGPSGCGKSTLLRMIAGLERITQGKISIAGRLVNEVEPKDRNIAMVFQNYALYPHMSVRENMAFGLKLHKVAKPEIEQRINKAATILQLTTLLDRKPSALSGGQRQRVAMGRAIVREPAVFLFDEPLSNLDAKLRVQMRLEIKQLHQELSATSVYVTHDQVEAMTMGDKLVVMNGGVVDQIGRPIEVYKKPRTLFVAGFIGSPPMNFINGEVNDAGEFHSATGTPITTDVPSYVPVGAAVCGVRPEEIKIVRDGSGGVAMRVLMIEPLGSETLVYCAADRSNVTIRVPGDVELSPGDELRAEMPDAALHFFDPETELRYDADDF